MSESGLEPKILNYFSSVHRNCSCDVSLESQVSLGFTTKFELRLKISYLYLVFLGLNQQPWSFPRKHHRGSRAVELSRRGLHRLVRGGKDIDRRGHHLSRNMQGLRLVVSTTRRCIHLQEFEEPCVGTVFATPHLHPRIVKLSLVKLGRRVSFVRYFLSITVFIDDKLAEVLCRGGLTGRHESKHGPQNHPLPLNKFLQV